MNAVGAQMAALSFLSVQVVPAARSFLRVEYASVLLLP